MTKATITTTTTGPRQPFSAEERIRAVRLVREQQDAYGTEWAAIRSIAEKIGRTGKRSACGCVRPSGTRTGLATDERERRNPLERKHRERERANGILREGSAFSTAVGRFLREVSSSLPVTVRHESIPS